MNIRKSLFRFSEELSSLAGLTFSLWFPAMFEILYTRLTRGLAVATEGVEKSEIRC